MEPTPPVPRVRKNPPSIENMKKPVPLPRKTQLADALDAPTEPPEEPVIIRRSEASSSSREMYEKLQEAKRSKDFANLTRETIEEGVLSVAKIAGRIVEQGMTGRRPVRRESNIDVSNSQPIRPPVTQQRPKSHTSDMDLFGTIRFNFPKNSERNNLPGPIIASDDTSDATNPDITNTNVQSTNQNIESEIISTLSVPIINFDSSEMNLYENTDTAVTYDVPNPSKLVPLSPSPSNDSNAIADNDELNIIYEDVAFTRINSKGLLLPLRKSPARPSNSTILEFDPLFAKAIPPKSDNSSNELLMKTILGDTYNDKSQGDTVSDEVEFDFFMENSEFCNMLPPPPPERFDSLVEGEKSPNANSEPSSLLHNTKWFLDEATPPKESQKKKSFHEKRESNSTIIKRFSTMLKSVPESASLIKKKFESTSKIEKPQLQKGSVQHRGHMTRLLAGPIDELFRNYQMRLCVLSNQIITCYTDSKITNMKEIYNLENLFSLQIIFSSKEESNTTLQCFQANFHNPGGFTSTRSSVIFGCHNKMERSNWILKITESLTDLFPSKYVMNMTRFGWCFIKENVSRAWSSGWLLLYQRRIYYHYTHDKVLQCLDLRKARCVVLQKDDDTASVNAEDGPNLIIDFEDKTLYVKMGNATETKIWRKIIYSAATYNGMWLYNQQLTKEDVPILVNKCINFIYSQGSLSDGIYRKVGSVSSVKAILDTFKNNAWGVQLSQRTHTEYDVSSALKQFFRDLPEPVLSPEIHHELYEATDLEKKEDKVRAYQQVLTKLHPISQNTLRKLFGHLHFIQSLSHENKMNSENLAVIWSPTLLSQHDASQQSFLRDAQVVRDLIELYIPIYNPSTTELDREKLMLVVLQKYQKNNIAIPQKPSGDFHIWIYINKKSSENSMNVVLSPGKTARELCDDHKTKLNITSDFIVEEVICGESMCRPIHYSEALLEVVFRWGYWEEFDRKDNYLVITKNNIFRASADTIEYPLAQQYFIGELKYANEKSKSFKLCTFHFNQGELCCYKDKLGNVLLEKWVPSEIFWYIGHEPKRNPQTIWALTIIRKNKNPRSKERPWFGTILGGHTSSDFKQLVGLLLHTEYPNKIFPTA